MANGTPQNFPGPKPLDPRAVRADRIGTLGNQAMQDQARGLLQAVPTFWDDVHREELKKMMSGLISPDPKKPNPELWKHEAQLAEWNTDIYPALSKAEGKYQNWVDDNGNYQGFQGLGKNWAEGGKGKNVGTMHGITAMNLAEYEGIDPYTITVAMMKGITRETASKIFKHQYYDRYKIGDIKDRGFRKLAGVMTPLRNAAVRIVKSNEKAGKTLKETVRDVILEYRNVGSDTKHNKYIKGWVNRARQVAEMKPFTQKDTLEDVYKVYPELRYRKDGRRRGYPPSSGW